jgi:predicted nucleic acid-binding protein
MDADNCPIKDTLQQEKNKLKSQAKEIQSDMETTYALIQDLHGQLEIMNNLNISNREAIDEKNKKQDEKIETIDKKIAHITKQMHQLKKENEATRMDIKELRNHIDNGWRKKFIQETTKQMMDNYNYLMKENFKFWSKLVLSLASGTGLIALIIKLIGG